VEGPTYKEGDEPEVKKTEKPTEVLGARISEQYFSESYILMLETVPLTLILVTTM
jgi:hypothetical protein